MPWPRSVHLGARCRGRGHFTSELNISVRGRWLSLSLARFFCLGFLFVPHVSSHSIVRENVFQTGAEIQAHADSHQNGEGNPQSSNQTDQQKEHVLTLVFQNKSSWTIKWVTGGIVTRRW